VARYYGAGAVGVVLSGTLSDGASGLRAIRRAGGLVVVQDPSDALYPGMPSNALAATLADHVVAADAMGPLLASLVAGPPPRPVAERNDPSEEGREPSEFPCPDCGGVLWWEPGDPEHLRCRVGHAWSIWDLDLAQREDVERALWVALRVIEDRLSLHQRMGERALQKHPRTAQRHEAEARALQSEAALLRGLLEGGGGRKGADIEEVGEERA
jgi:two-component system chemotaxis response regulator CheB